MHEQRPDKTANNWESMNAGRAHTNEGQGGTNVQNKGQGSMNRSRAIQTHE